MQIALEKHGGKAHFIPTMRSWLSNILLTAAVTAFCLLGLEFSLRWFFPKYQNAATSFFERDVQRIVSRKPYKHAYQRRPDRKVLHRVRYNNYGMAHSLDLDPAELEQGLVIGIFGDSFIENLRIRGGYPLTQVLQHLLNVHRLNTYVLNFGVDGYGTDQSFLYYKSSELSPYIDQAYYFACVNDIRNLFENQLFAINEKGVLEQRPLPHPNPLLKFISHYHTTYLILDGWNRINPEHVFTNNNIYDTYAKTQLHQEQISRHHVEIISALDKAVKENANTTEVLYYSQVFTGLLKTWTKLAQERGHSFHTVLLPRKEEQAIKHLVPQETPMIDLYSEFTQRLSDYNYATDAKFVTDDHWDERGNLMAALWLYRTIVQSLGIEPMSPAKIDQVLDEHYKRSRPRLREANLLEKLLS